MKVSWYDEVPNIWKNEKTENRKCSKPSTSINKYYNCGEKPYGCLQTEGLGILNEHHRSHVYARIRPRETSDMCVVCFVLSNTINNNSNVYCA